MKIVVVSDSHGNSVKLREIVSREKPFEFIVHCGDGVNDLLHAAVPSDAVTLAVAGNIDLGRGFAGERVIITDIAGRRIMITHGDMFRAHGGLSLLDEEARKRAADIVLFGHTHVKFIRESPPVLFNPGSANNGFYGVITIETGASFVHRNVD